MEDKPQHNSTPQDTKPKNHPIKIDDEYLSQNCIEKCIKEFNEIPDEPNHLLEIITTKAVKEVDPLLIAYFILFKEQKQNLEIILKLHEKTSGDVNNKFRQHRAHAMLTYGKDIFVFTKNETVKAEQDTEWSKSFLPIMYIDQNKYASTFINKINFQPLHEIAFYDQSSEILYQNCRAVLLKQFRDDKDGLKCLAQLAFYKALDDVKILSFYLYKDFHNNNEITKEAFKDKEEKYKIGSLVNEDALRFYEEVNKTSIFKELSKKPPIYNFIYSTLLSSKLLPGKLTSNNSKNFINILKNLWIFTQQLVDGLDELAKNIYEHSSNKCGVITGRVYSSGVFQELQSTSQKNKEVFEKYLNSFKNSMGNIIDRFFEINVIDGGGCGVVQKVKDDLKNTYVKEFEQDDMNLFINNEIKFSNFLKASNSHLLNQQTKRATAHLGLLIFSKLIEENKGLIRAGTWAINSTVDRDNVLSFPKIEKTRFNDDSAPLCSYGTNYHFLLPFNPQIKIKPTIPIKYELPFESTTIEMKSIENLLNFYVKDYSPGYPKELVLEDDKNYLFITNSNVKLSASKREQEEEFWKDITGVFLLDHIKRIKESNPKKRSFVCLDFNRSDINVSQLFRLLGRWELEFSGYPLIVFNISIDLFFKLIEINEFFIEKVRKVHDINYWNINSLILFYCFEETENGKFYFSDALWGAERNDYLFINQLIHKTNFNATITLLKFKNPDDSNLKKVIDSTEELISRNKITLSRFGPFQNGITLLPFDLLLNSSEGLTLFEHNASVLLQNELKPESEV